MEVDESGRGKSKNIAPSKLHHLNIPYRLLEPLHRCLSLVPGAGVTLEEEIVQLNVVTNAVEQAF